MRSDRLYRLLESYPAIVPAIVVILIVIFGGIGVYLAEHNHPGANITNLGDAFWWAIVTITTVGYGEYFPLTLVGRMIGVLVMLSGIGTAVIIVTIFADRRLKGLESRLKPNTDVHPRLFGAETKKDIKVKIDGIEKLTEEDFDNLVTMMKSLRLTLLEESKNLSKCSRCGNAYYNKPKFCSNCGLELTSNIP
jgi:voltage-gated potassium channel